MTRIPLLMLLTILALQAPLRAQQSDVVFLHGLGSAPGVWSATVDRLDDRLSMRPFLPTLNWRLHYEVQAAQAQQQIGAAVSGDVAALGHSNGGIVARTWSKYRDVGSLVTLGSPNQGAPFVDHIFDWFTFADDIFIRMSNVYTVFYEWMNPDTWWWVPGEWRPLFEAVSDFWGTSSSGIFSLGFDVRQPVLSEMRVWSPFMRNLNSPSNLNREAIEVPRRAAIVSIAGEFDHGGPFRLLKPDNYEDWHNALMITGISVEVLSIIVRLMADPWDYGAFLLADHLGTVAEWALQFEEVWCRSVSDPSPLYMARCYAHDGIVPAWSQAYDHPRVQFFVMNNGPIHTQEVAQSDDTLYLALTTVAHVPPAVTPPPPTTDPPPEFGRGRFRMTLAGCYWDANQTGIDECAPQPAKGAFRVDGQGACYADANSYPPDQCTPPAVPMGRYKPDIGACRWDPNDSGPSLCVP